MYVYVLRDKTYGLASAEICQISLVDTDNVDIMFRVSVPDAIAAQRLIDDLNIPMMIFGEPDVNRVDRSIYAATVMDKERLQDELTTMRETIELRIRHKNVIISNLEAEIADNRNRVSSMKTILENIMNTLALDTALERTHRERNETMRFIIRWIKRVLDSDPLEFDDIPF